MARAAAIINAIVFVGLLTVIVLVVIPYGTVDAWWEAVFECVVFGLTALWFLEVVLRGSWEITRALVLVPLLLLAAYIFVQTVPLLGRTLTIDSYQTRLTALKMLALTLFTGLLLLHASTMSRLRWLVRVVIAVGLTSALFGILRQLLQAPSSTNGFVLPFLFPAMGYAQFLSANVFAYLMELSLGLLAGLLLGGGVKRQHVLIYLSAGLMILTTLVLSRSRGGVLAFVCEFTLVVIIGVAWYAERRAKRDPAGGRLRWLNIVWTSMLARIVVIVLMVMMVIAGVLWMGGDKLAEKQSSAQIVSDGTTRREIWHSTWSLIKQHPLTGVGFGAYFLAIPEYQTGPGRVKVEQAHNDYLELAANGGLIALVLVGCFVGIIVWRARFTLRSRDPYRRAAALGALAGILSVGVHSLVDFGLQVTGIAVVFASLIIILIADLSSGQKTRHRSRKRRSDHQTVPN